MKLPLRSLGILTSGFLCLGTCYAVASGHLAQTQSVAHAEETHSDVSESVVIPGQLRSFLRMAGISQEISPEDVLPLLARNVYLRGYENGQETEFLLLLNRYVQYARELRQLAGNDGTIRVAGCDDAVKLIQVLGYEFEQTCGQKNAYLRAVNAERAFLTLDSGFPLTRLEDSLQEQTPFTYSFPDTRVPVLFSEKDWTDISSTRHKNDVGLVDVLLHDESVDRLYWALSKNDQETQIALRRALRALLPVAPALDFYGSQISVHSGHVLVPGGQAAERSWEDIAGASPTSPVSFVLHLLAKDHGWLAAYFDAMAHVSREQQFHLTQEPRLKLLYDVYRRPDSGGGSTRGVFPRNADLMVLFTRLQWQPNGQPYIPGSLTVWREILSQDSTPELIRGWVKHANTWDTPDQVLLTLVACSRFETDTGPLQLYLALSAIDLSRAGQEHLSEKTIRLIDGNFFQFHDWYPIFSEFPALNDSSITLFINAADAVSKIEPAPLRANAMGAFQANVGLWQILARQREIPSDKINQSWQEVVQPFTAASSSMQLFNASRSSLRSLLINVKGTADLSQDQIIDLLAGPPQTSEDGQRVHMELAERIRTVLDDQRLASLDTLFGLYDGLDEMAHGASMRDQLVQLAGTLRDFEMPRPIFTESEKISWAPGIYTSRHAELQVRTDLTKVIQRPASGAQLEAARGQLAPFLRDTLVGLNYAYYEPPGSQALHHNPLFVRSHDFTGVSIQGYDTIWDSPDLIGVGVTAGGGAYLIGSLADLPYALASTEEDFIAPDHVQALIWKAVVPALLVSAVQPRWWGIDPKELHAVALYQRVGEELLIDSAQNAQLRGRIIAILSDLMEPKRLEFTERSLTNQDDATALIPQITPVEKFYLAVEFRKEFPADAVSSGPAGQELDNLVRSDSSETNPERLSIDFGVPHPTLAQTNACGILAVKPFPAFAGYGYRLLGESWESTNLYWARLADEMGYSPTALNLLVPVLTRRMIANIFATDLEDWPALLRAMEQTGQEFREGQIAVATPGVTIQH